ncbi:MAG: putative quinol monooxygenase [Anaerovoracaceae bacterium]
MKPVVILVMYTAKDGMREKFLDEVISSGVPELVRAENGCIQYDYFYAAEDKNTILLLEKWESAEHQKYHMTMPHMETLTYLKDKYIVDTKVTFL